MHVKRIELENIKSHAESAIDFERGTTAITGPNGAGKTTLIEAIAWTLFDVLDYKKEDFIKRGTKKGVVRVTFESSLDEREYVVYRDTGTGYYVYDPRLQMRIADKKEEVCRFLWQHLGVEPGTDLKSLFRQAIGVPQGTMTSDFLRTPEQRKPIFDKLLRVDEYRRGADELLKTSRHVELLTGAVRERIARAEGEIAMIDRYEEEFATASKLLADQQAEIAVTEDNAAAVRQTVERLDAAEKALREESAAAERVAAELAKAEIVAGQCEMSLEQGRQAAVIVERVRTDAERHAAASGRLAELERERGEREKLLVAQAKTDAAISVVTADARRTQEEFGRALKAHAEITELEPACLQEAELSREIEQQRNELAGVRAVARQIASLDEKIVRLRESYRSNQSQLTEAATRSQAANGLDELQKRDADIVRELARLQANLERDELFQKEIQNNLCPILSQRCLNLREGQTLEAFVSGQLPELRRMISALETEHSKVASGLETSRAAKMFVKSLETLTERSLEIAAEGKRLRDEKDSLERELQRAPELETSLAVMEKRLLALDSPRARVEGLKKEAAREGELRRDITTIESNLERLRSELSLIVEQLENYKDLDTQLAEASQTRASTEAAYRMFIANEAAAAEIKQREKACSDARDHADNLNNELIKAKEKLTAAERDYDPRAHQTARADLLVLQTRAAELRAAIANTSARVEALARELKRLAEIRESMRSELREKERLEKVSEVTTFVRDTLKNAAPLVARNYVHHVSVEANQMFREISGNAERTLKWADDYGIQLEEDGYDRPLSSLSGGEQMAAAMSVRLSLLKQLSDIRIAFFDEPTTNMDAGRRENLATEIGKIKHFEQLFVISHDDTFEGHMDHEIRIGE